MSKVRIEDFTDDFRGTQRFEIRQRLGGGAYGTVYRAYDRKRLTSVALKTLHHMDPESLYSFKREFRSLADVTHPNLITLYEFMTDGALWFFTMELVEGVDFLEYVRNDSGSGLPFDEGRLRDALKQLAEGVAAIHEAGKLHRDIKPTNVLVTKEGRVVLIDFGLAAELSKQGAYQSRRIDGTPVYMSPEQGIGRPLTKATDWYSVGVMLFEALTGYLPFDGIMRPVIVEKQLSEAPSPGELNSRIPEDLDRLCRNLLQKDPAQRPTESDILYSLSNSCPATRPVAVPSAPSPVHETQLVGRDRHLLALWEAFKDAKAGSATTVYLQGRSGTGKTTLARRFLDELSQSDEKAIILMGRCYKQESVPYKALDSIVDALSRYLRGLPNRAVEAILPADAAILSRLFPVLRQVDAVTEACRNAQSIPDSNEQRRRAFAALKELLSRLAELAPTVLFIDDLQWGDLDSASLLAEILQPPDPPAILLIGSYRSEEIEDSPFLKAFRSSRAFTGHAADIREMSIGELSIMESIELAFALSGGERPMTFAEANSIARESGGNPFFVNELVRYSNSRAPVGGYEDGAAALNEVITARVAQLPIEARHMLEVVAVSGRPLERSVVRRALICIEDEEKTLALLVTNHLIRTTGADKKDEIEVYHDRIRETVLSGLSAYDLRSFHHNLALALEASREVDPERLVTHFQEAGNDLKAAEYAVAAAEKASEALAFDRAARLYRTALELSNRPLAGRKSLSLDFQSLNLQGKLADALAKAGRGREAATEYLAAAGDNKGAEALEYRRRAAKQYLCSGHIDEGLEVIRDVLGRVGIDMPEGFMRSTSGLLWRRAQIKLRGLGFREREESEIPPKELIKVDTCWSVSIGLGIVDTILGADFQARHLLLALRAGEPFRVARALAMEIGYSAVSGVHSRSRTEALIKKTCEVAEKNGHPHALGLTALMKGIAAFLMGDWREAVELCAKAEKILHERCTGVTWELDTSRLIQLRCLFYFGELNEMLRRLPALIKDALERGDLYAAANLIGRILCSALLAADEPNEARAKLKQALEGWSRHGFYYQHYFNMVGRVETELYSGCGDEAWRLINGQWQNLVDSRLQNFQFVLIESLFTRARAAISAACDAAIPEPLLAAAEHDLKLIEHEKTAWGNALALLLRAGIASFNGLRKEAVKLLLLAESSLEVVDMDLYAKAARRCRGRLTGGDEGEALIRSADEWMITRKIKNPKRMSEMIAVGKY